MRTCLKSAWIKPKLICAKKRRTFFFEAPDNEKSNKSNDEARDGPAGSVYSLLEAIVT